LETSWRYLCRKILCSRTRRKRSAAHWAERSDRNDNAQSMIPKKPALGLDHRKSDVSDLRH
jgi:hypothetical protein